MKEVSAATTSCQPPPSDASMLIQYVPVGHSAQRRSPPTYGKSALLMIL